MRSTETRVWIAQCLCPDRHCILAATGEASSEAEAIREIRTPLRRAITELLRGGVLNGECGLCGAKRTTWHYEIGRTPFTSLEEAQPAIQAMERSNLLANLLYGDLHKTKPN